MLSTNLASSAMLSRESLSCFFSSLRLMVFDRAWTGAWKGTKLTVSHMTMGLDYRSHHKKHTRRHEFTLLPHNAIKADIKADMAMAG